MKDKTMVLKKIVLHDLTVIFDSDFSQYQMLQFDGDLNLRRDITHMCYCSMQSTTINNKEMQNIETISIDHITSLLTMSFLLRTLRD
jgi:hypothetical protein